MKLINKIKLALFKHRNKKLEQLDYIDWNFIKNTINNDKKVKIQEPQTIAEMFKKYELFFLISCLYSNSKKVMFSHNYDFNLLEKENLLIMNNIIRENEKLYI